MPLQFLKRFQRRRWRWNLIGLAAASILLLFLYDQLQPTAQDVGPPTIVSRIEWGAEPPDPSLDKEAGPEIFNTVVVHHSAMLPTEGPRDIQYVHMHRRSFLDIGYHFVIDREGRIYEGRSLTRHGAHVSGHNAGTLGIVLTGNYEILEPMPIQRMRLKGLIQTLQRQYPITHLAGHGDFAPGKTLCPGKNLEPLLPALASELGLQFGAGGYVGPEPVSATANSLPSAVGTP